MTVPADLPQRSAVLDGVRGIAILMVMAFHIQSLAVDSGHESFAETVYVKFTGMGWAGVDLFFVLSGFLITTILYRSRTHAHYFRVFYGRRVLRIFPLYYLTLALFFFAAPVILRLTSHEELLADPLFQAPGLLLWTYLFNWREVFPGLPTCSPLLQHFWSLAVEEQFYLIWPWVIWALDRRAITAFCVLVIVAAFQLRMFFWDMGTPNIAVDFAICRFDELAMGALVALYWLKPAGRVFLAKGAPFVALFALYFLILIPVQYTVTYIFLMFGLFFASCIPLSLALPEGSYGHRMLSSAVLRFFGKHSYAMYVVHQPLIILLARAGLNAAALTETTGTRAGAILLLNLAMTGVASFVAWALWHLVEKHFLALKERPWFHR